MQPRKRTNQQLRTVSEVTQQQIMDNVAKVAANENGWPDYSRLSSGVIQVSDNAGASLGFVWDARTIVSETLGLSGGRQVSENWTTNAVTDPDRLRATWAVYHYTVYGDVPNNETYNADEQLTQIFGVDWRKQIPAPGWFKTYREHDYCERVECGCVIGHACDCRTCVLPGHQQDLQQLTYAIIYIDSVTFKDKMPFPNGIQQRPVKADGRPLMGSSSKSETDISPIGKLPTGPARETYTIPNTMLLNPR